MAGRGENITTFHFSGPAIKEIWHVTFVQWVFAVIFPFVVSSVSSCPHAWHPFAHYPSFVWSLFLLLLGWSLYREAMCLRWVIYTQALYCAPFRLLGTDAIFNVWLAFMLFLGLASHADIATNGLFMAKILKTVECHRQPMRTIEDMWAFVIKESVVRDLPFFGSLEMLLVVCWGIMFLQPFIGLLSAFPCKGVLQTNYEMGVGRDAPQQGEMYGYVTPCSWLQQLAGSEKKVHHADALKWLAVVNRMVSITDQSLMWTLKRGKQKLEQAQTKTGEAKQEGIKGVYDMLSREFAFNLYRLFLVNLLEKICMLEAQTTIFAISRCMMPQTLARRFDFQMLFSVGLSFITFLKTVVDARDQLAKICRFWNEIAQEDTSSMWKLLLLQMCCRDPWQMEWHRARMGFEPVDGLPVALEIVRKRRRMYLLLTGFVAVTVALVFALLHSACKFVMAWVCPHSLWNIPTPWREEKHTDWRGCVDLSQFLGYD